MGESSAISWTDHTFARGVAQYVTEQPGLDHGSGVSQAICLALGIDPDEVVS